MSADDHRRYEEIQRRIRQRKLREQQMPVQSQIAGVLNEINAYGFLEDLRAVRYRQILCYGPKIVNGMDWAGVVIWCRGRDYYAYKSLTLLGIWAFAEDDSTQLVVGTRTLTFNAPYFNPESYNRHIKTRFDIYYAGDASPPPPGQLLFTLVYIPANRLDIRAQIERVLKKWQQGQQ